MGRIYLITTSFFDDDGKYLGVFVSHGVDEDTGENVVLPPENLGNYQISGAQYCHEVGEWFISK